MVSRRAPLSNNPNAANSPLRHSHSVLSKNTKAFTRITTAERDPQQPPPAKKQALNNGSQRPLSHRESYATVEHRPRLNAVEAKLSKERSGPLNDNSSNPGASNRQRLSNQELHSLRQWQSHHRAKFPSLVFYFEKVPENERCRCKRQLCILGAREEPFFSNHVTHVVTTRAIPCVEKRKTCEEETELGRPDTINPAVLNRDSSRRNLDASSRRAQALVPQEDSRRARARNADVLLRARDLNMKIWSLDKFQRVLELLLEDKGGQGRAGSHGGQSGASKSTGEPSLLQMLQNERANGPSDRDPTAASKELQIFKGPYIYIYDVTERLRPIMMREYAKVSSKQDGDWPQFRSVAGGRCPFVEEPEAAREALAERERRRATKMEEARQATKSGLGKRTLSQMQDSQRIATAPSRAMFEPPKRTLSRDMRENAFTSRAVAPRLLAGEPVASGLQKSKITSTIQSQMISSTPGVLGAKAGTSIEVQGLQRAVLERHTPVIQREGNSRGAAETSAHDEGFWGRPVGQMRTGRQRLKMIEEECAREAKAKTIRPSSTTVMTLQKRDPKPGYCENCQEKFDDFDEHTESRKHRRFAENCRNWTDLDDLLTQLVRPLKD